MTTRARRIVPLRDSKGELEGSPSKHDFELLKLERELNYFRAEMTRLRGAIRDKDLALKAQADLWHLGMDFGEWPTMEALLSVLPRCGQNLLHTPMGLTQYLILAIAANEMVGVRKEKAFSAWVGSYQVQ